MNVEQKPQIPLVADRRQTLPARKRTGRPWLTGLLAAVLIAGTVAWVVHHLRAPEPSGAAPSATAPTAATGKQGRRGGGPAPVVAMPVQKGELPITLNALGTVTPLASVTVKTQIAGQLVSLGFQEGQMVKAGDFLAQIDPRPYQQQQAQYEGQLLRDQALLKEARLNLARYRTLVAQDSIARQTLDTQESLVAQYEGAVRTDQAQIDTAKLNQTYCRILAPTGGRVGLRQVDPGNYVQTGDANGIVVITQLQPISVIFTLPEDALPAVQARLRDGATLPVTVFNRSQTARLAGGRLLTTDNQIDPATGTVKLRAQFDNPEQQLFPNQFVNVQLLVDSLHDAILAPAAAIQRGAPGTFVYLVRPDNTVTLRKVTLGPAAGEQVAITAGLEPGDLVVVDGADRLREDAPITLPAAKAGEAGGGADHPQGEQPQGERPKRDHGQGDQGERHHRRSEP